MVQKVEPQKNCSVCGKPECQMGFCLQQRNFDTRLGDLCPGARFSDAECHGCPHQSPEKRCEECFGTGKMTLTQAHLDLIIERRNRGETDDLRCPACTPSPASAPCTKCSDEYGTCKDCMNKTAFPASTGGEKVAVTMVMCTVCLQEAPSREMICHDKNCSRAPTTPSTEEAGKEAEIVICAAVRFNGKVWRGNRHPHAIAAMRDELSYTMTRKQMDEAHVTEDQGFVTSRNRYVDREEGLAIQKAAGIPCFRGEYGDQLYSEDLY